jgi:hypothetical protein
LRRRDRALALRLLSRSGARRSEPTILRSRASFDLDQGDVPRLTFLDHFV